MKPFTTILQGIAKHITTECKIKTERVDVVDFKDLTNASNFQAFVMPGAVTYHNIGDICDAVFDVVVILVLEQSSVNESIWDVSFDIHNKTSSLNQIDTFKGLHGKQTQVALLDSEESVAALAISWAASFRIKGEAPGIAITPPEGR